MRLLMLLVSLLPAIYLKPADSPILCSIDSTRTADALVWEITLTNTSDKRVDVESASLSLGVDTYMDKYPEWLDKFFPTFLYCERTHFYGYLQSPSGKILALASPDPIASWHLDYNISYEDPPGYPFWGHRIEDVKLDLLHCLPLPKHHPQTLSGLNPRQTITWTIYLKELDNLGQFARETSKMAGIPVIELEKTSYEPREMFSYKVHGEDVKVRARVSALKGSHKITATDKYGHETTATVHIRRPWSKAITGARKAALRYKQHAGSHIETSYGFYSAFLAAKYFPDPEKDKQLVTRFDYLLNLQVDTLNAHPLIYESRIQNTAGIIGMLTDKYEAYGDIKDLRLASRLCDWLIDFSQAPDGAFMNGETVYTSVIYIAKSVMELAQAEEHSRDSSMIMASYRHMTAAGKAVDQLVRARGDFNTEGEITFEDGMVSCSALQMGQLALLTGDPAKRALYTGEMLRLLGEHDCLTQNFVPDARRRGGTLRFWEAQYDVMLIPNMISSPHGWSAWRAYATYYAYLLTGEEKWLRQTFDAADAFAQLIDGRTGELRWAFVVDPYVRGVQADEPIEGSSKDSLLSGNPNPACYPNHEKVLGECYVPMVSDYQTVNVCDNDVHEAFKFIAEAVLTRAFILERPDGSIGAYNCKVRRRGKTLIVKADEKQIKELSVNLKSDYEVRFSGNISSL